MNQTVTDITFIIPAYNEERRISRVLQQYPVFYPDADFLVVIEGTDKTAEITETFAQKNPQISYIVSDGRLGKGGAVIKGFLAARTQYAGFIDCDTSIEPGDLMGLLSALPSADGIIGSRKLKDSVISVHQPSYRRIASSFFNTIIRALFDLPFSDTQCGAKFFRTEILHNVAGDMRTHGFEFDVELLWRLKNRGYTILEIPIAWKHSDDSTFNLTYAFSMFFSLLKIRFCR